MAKISPLKYTRMPSWVGNDGNTYKLRRRGNPDLWIRYSTYTGGCAIGAMHYYCRVTGQRPSIYDCTEKRWLFAGGYGPDCPKIDDFTFEAERKLTKIEFDMSGDRIGGIGDTTSRFNDPHEAVRAGIETARANFRDTKVLYWDVQFEYCGDDLECKHFRLADLEDIDAIMERVEFYG